MDVEALQEALAVAQDHIACLNDDLGKFLAEPLVHATVIHAHNELDPSKFQGNDLVVFVDGSRDNGRTARIIDKGIGNAVVDDDGYIEVLFPDLRRRKAQIGMGGRHPAVKLLGKDDGTNVTISVDGTPYEVHGVFGKTFEPGQAIKVNEKSKQIVEAEGMHGAGDVVYVKTLVDEEHLEIEHNGIPRIVLNGRPDIKLEANDRVQLDRSNTVVIRQLKRLNEDLNTVTEEVNVSWDDIGGCDEAKEAMIDLFELPFMHPEIYKFYNKKMPKGGLLFGPPGCGKTMLGKAAYTSLCKRFGKQAMASGWIYVKGPELLNMWLGNSEANIRELFRRGERHYKKTGVPAVMFIDEAEAVLPMRGSGRCSDIEKTTVPMFLSEMDGLEVSRTIVLLATNRPELIDPAAVRFGRCDRHVKVPRPNPEATADIFKIHLKGVPLASTDPATVTEVITDKLFSKDYVLYRLREGNNGHAKEHLFYLQHILNGAMIAGVVEQATSTALKRDLNNGKKPKGVLLTDFHDAVDKIYRGQMDQNHTFDLEDFCDVHKVSKCDLAIDKLKAVS